MQQMVMVCEFITLPKGMMNGKSPYQAKGRHARSDSQTPPAVARGIKNRLPDFFESLHYGIKAYGRDRGSIHESPAAQPQRLY